MQITILLSVPVADSFSNDRWHGLLLHAPTGSAFPSA